MKLVRAYLMLLLVAVAIEVAACDSREKSAQERPGTFGDTATCSTIRTRSLQRPASFSREQLCTLIQRADSVLRTAPDTVLVRAASVHVDSAVVADFEFRDLQGRVTRSYWSIDFTVSGGSKLLTVELPRDGRSPSVRNGHSR